MLIIWILLVCVGLIGVGIAVASRRLERNREKEDGNDPYAEFDVWLRRNGFADVAGCTADEVDLDRLERAVEAYFIS